MRKCDSKTRTVICGIKINVVGDLRGAVPEEEPWGLRGVVADELEVGLPEAAGRADAKGIAEGQIPAAALATGERGSGWDAHIAVGSLHRWCCSTNK